MIAQMKEFTVHGPFEVPLELNKKGKMVAQDLSDFWADLDQLGEKKGVYVFAMRAGRGYTPNLHRESCAPVL